MVTNQWVCYISEYSYKRWPNEQNKNENVNKNNEIRFAYSVDRNNSFVYDENQATE